MRADWLSSPFPPHTLTRARQSVRALDNDAGACRSLANMRETSEEPIAVPTPIDATPSVVPVGPIASLVVVGENVELHLPAAQARFTIGAAGPPAVDLTLQSPYLSRVHAVLERKGNKLRVVDQRSTNGTFRRGQRDPDFDIAAGEVFELSRHVKLLALDPSMAVLRRKLLWVVGLKDRAAADDAIENIATNAPILLVGPPECEQVPIAVEVHRRSGYSDRGLVVAERVEDEEAREAVLRRGEGSTVYLDLAPLAAPLAPPFVARLFASTRLILSAPSEARAFALLGAYARRLKTIELKAPAERADDIPRLLEALVIEEHTRRVREGSAPAGELLPFAALGEQNLEGLRRHLWPGNFAELRSQVRRLHAALTNGLRIRATARALGLRSHTSLIEALGRIGVSIGRSDDAGMVDGAGEDVPAMPGVES